MSGITESSNCPMSPVPDCNIHQTRAAERQLTYDIQSLALKELIHVNSLFMPSPLENAHQALIDFHHMPKAMPAKLALQPFYTLP